MWPLKAHSQGDGRLRSPGTEVDLLFALSDALDQSVAQAVASENHWRSALAPTVEQALACLASSTVAVVFLDRALAGGDDWRSAFRLLHERQPGTCLILVSPVADHYLFEEVVKHGGYEVLAKPLKPDECARMARLAFAFWRNRRSARLSE